MQLCSIPNKEVCKQATGALLNLALHNKNRARMGDLGGINAMLGMYPKSSCFFINPYFPGFQVLLVNLVLKLKKNRYKLNSCKGLCVVNNFVISLKWLVIETSSQMRILYKLAASLSDRDCCFCEEFLIRREFVHRNAV